MNAKWPRQDLLAIFGLFLLLGVGGFAVFYAGRGDPIIQQVPIPNQPAQGSEGDGESRTLSIVTLLPRDAIPAILQPEFVSVQAAGSQLMDAEPVIGLVVGGERRAYPVNMLSRHEIVNDVVGGEPVAVTW